MYIDDRHVPVGRDVQPIIAGDIVLSSGVHMQKLVPRLRNEQVPSSARGTMGTWNCELSISTCHSATLTINNMSWL